MNRIIYAPRLQRFYYYSFVVLMFLSGYYAIPVRADKDLSLADQYGLKFSPK